ncbi:MAG: phosphatidylinositol-specific phospholipase C1-like protein [Balneolaceae bacterium]|nr:phosphatidylinositol-specific phospholipase C1-like protein [Balneolaceae bacterium]
MKYNILFVLSLLILISCSGNNQDTELISSAVDCAEVNAENRPECIRINHIQVLGTHNSYKLKPHPELVSEINKSLDGWSRNIDYEHRPLAEQLGELGIRQFELDVFADTAGGLFSEPAGALISGDEAFLNVEEMAKPGLKVLHGQDLDYRTSCMTLISCLSEIKEWSSANPSHLPLFIMIEAKDGVMEDRGPLKFTKPVVFTDELLHGIDDEIREVFVREHLITPDDVRGGYETLEEAITTIGWPTLAESRGKVMFALDNTGRHKDLYLSGSPNLENRVLFVSSEPGEPTAGFIKMNNVLDQGDRIKEYTAAGFLVRTRSDIPTEEARSGDTTRRDLALESGAQFISTDYPEQSPYGSGYIVTLPGVKGPARCNPVTAPEYCEKGLLDE